MSKYVIRRIVQMLLVLLGVTIVVFSINYISPGDPVNQIAGIDADPAVKEAIRAELGLDKPFLVQLWNYIVDLLHLDLGTSYMTKLDVMDSILGRLPVTLKFALLAVAISTAIGIPLGIISAIKQNTLVDYISTFTALIGASVPSFWLALVMMILFSVKLDWLPATGLDSWKGWIMPTISMSIYPIATITRTTRASMLEVIRADYMRTARSKGLTEQTIIKRHALGNALIPVITVVGMQLGAVLGGVIVVESVFNIQGLGMLLNNAIASKDTPVIMGTVLFSAFMMSAINLIVDILYAFVDPRIKAQYVNSSGKKKTMKVNTAGEAKK